MKVLTDSPTQLVLQEGALVTRVLGGSSLLLGLGMTVYFSINGSNSSKRLLILGPLFIIVGALVTLFSKSDLITVEKIARTVTLTRKSLKNPQGKSATYSFDDISSVVTTQNNRGQTVKSGQNTGVGISENAQTILVTTLTIQLKSGQSITIANDDHQVSDGVKSPIGSMLPTLGQKLADALGVGFQAAGITELTTAPVGLPPQNEQTSS